MRTTVTLDPDVAALIQRAMRERGVSFKRALNDAVRAGITSGPPSDTAPPPSFPMGAPLVDLTKALRLAGELEDQERAAHLARGR